MDWLNSVVHADEAAIHRIDEALAAFVTADVGDGETPFLAIRMTLLFLDNMGNESVIRFHLAEDYVILGDLLG